MIRRFTGLVSIRFKLIRPIRTVFSICWEELIDEKLGACTQFLRSSDWRIPSDRLTVQFKMVDSCFLIIEHGGPLHKNNQT